LWDVKDVKSIKQLPKRDGHTGTLYTVQFTPEGKMVTAGRDGTAKVWDVNTEIEATK
jgi:WD40 repeat protein